MQDEDLKAPENEIDEMGTVTLMLGLYLIILAFFILLNALAEESELKASQAQESIARGFGFHIIGEDKSTQMTTSTSHPVFDRVVKEIESVLQSFVAVRNYRITSLADQMVITLKTKDIFMPAAVRIQPAMTSFFKDLGNVLSVKRAGTVLVSQVVVSSDNMDVSGAHMSVDELSARRAALFVRALIERGVMPENVSAAVQQKGISEIKIFVDINIFDARKAQEGLRK